MYMLVGIEQESDIDGHDGLESTGMIRWMTARRGCGRVVVRKWYASGNK